MSFLAKDRKKDLVALATELGEKIDEDLRAIDLRELIMKIPIFTMDVEFNSKYYARQPENQRSDDKQNYSRSSKMEFEREPTIHCDRTYKRSTTQNDKTPTLSGVSSQSRTDPFLHVMVVEPLE
ncbi:hypothetical protein CDAR_65471 [Caerostris darwini]|uniref:Uncharacterized protein n=1 Tax=Caerostris darwini TaxID=1538125 RepID=A0AAV4VXA0_9ARAC|nr:hypothetical protein CDAR_65471 [Caerostris darwini]